MLSHYEGCTSREVSALTGLNESTVRVHLFRAIRRLRTLLAQDAAAAAATVAAGGEKRRVTS
jgi:DNA-directed RNA polymerase specialized sigma24 family protein